MSSTSPTGSPIQREDNSEWIFIACKQNKKSKTYVEKFSKLILKGKNRLHQFEEIVVFFINVEIASLWAENEHWLRA